MKDPLKYVVLTLLVVLGSRVAANATPDKKSDLPPTPGHDRTAPEISPSLAVVGLCLLAGALTVVRRRLDK